MALRRVRSKSEPVFESVQSDEAIAASPDVWDVLDGEPDISALMRASEAAMEAGVPTVSHIQSSGPRRSTAISAGDPDLS